MTIVIDTVRDHLQGGYKLDCWCPRCKRGFEYPLTRLVMLGKGGTPLSQIRLRHGCGSAVELRRRPPLYNDQ